MIIANRLSIITRGGVAGVLIVPRYKATVIQDADGGFYCYHAGRVFDMATNDGWICDFLNPIQCRDRDGRVYTFSTRPVESRSIFSLISEDEAKEPSNEE